MARKSHEVAGDPDPGGAVSAAHPPQATLPIAPPSATPPPEAPPSAPAPQSEELRVTRTAVSTTYVGVAGGLLVLVVVLIFIIQNLHNASVHFFTANFRLPIGLIVVAAVVAGGLLVLLTSAARVLQLRSTARKHRRSDQAARA